MDFLNYDARRFFLLAVRICFGIWLMYAGFFKWFSIGGGAFADAIAADFDKTRSPHMLNIALACLIFVAEPVLALFLLSGRQQRIAWTLTAALMFLLTLGQSILMKPDVIANWQYLVLTIVCAALSDPPRLSQETRTNV